MEHTKTFPPQTGPSERGLDLSPKVSDEIRKTTCYMCACRCGVNVHIRKGADGREIVSYLEGNRDHPTNQGVLCAKGSSGIMQHYSPARLRKPLKRVGPRGSGTFEEISWDEALSLATEWLKPIREDDPKKLAFFTGRDQSQSFTSWWAQAFGTPNYAAHGGFCSVNMAAGGIYTMGGAFWEFGTADWDRSKMFMIFGVAEDHDSNPIKIGLGKLKANGAKIVGVNPVRTGYNAIADEWVGITPGTDGLFVIAIIHELLKAGKVDVSYLVNFTNAPWLVINDPGAPDHGLFARDKDGNALVIDRRTGKAAIASDNDAKPDLKGEVTLKDGRKARPVFAVLAEKYLDEKHAPEAVAETCGVPAETMRRLAAELAHTAFEEEIVLDRAWTDWRGRKHDKMVGRPVSFHAMRGISAHSNGFQTTRAIHLLQILLGSVETPGGFRFKPPYPKPVEGHPKPNSWCQPNAPLAGPHLGYPLSPEHLQLDHDGNPLRIDKAYSWEAPLAAHGLMHMVIANAAEKDPYGIDVLFLYMANMAWNSSMNTKGVMEMLTRTDENGEYVIPKIIYSDAYSSETVAYADLILPDTTYLERHDCISLLDRPISEPDAAADAIRWPVVQPDRDVRGFQSALLDLGARLGLPGFVDDQGKPVYKDYADYIVNHERRPGVGPLSGFRGADGDKVGRGEKNTAQLDKYIKNGGFFVSEIPEDAQFFKPWNQGYQDWAVSMGFYDKPQPYVFDIYSEPLRRFQLAAEGHGENQPPDNMRDRVKQAFEPLPTWYPTFEGELIDEEAFPYHAITQRPMAMYHSWGSQNAWLRQIHGRNPLYVPEKVAQKAGLKSGDWAWVTSHHGRIRVPVHVTAAANEKTLWTWNAIGKRKGAWALETDAPESNKGFLLNHLIHELLPPKGDGMRWTNSDPVTGQAAWFDLRVNIEKADAPGEDSLMPDIPAQKSPVGFGPERVEFGKAWK